MSVKRFVANADNTITNAYKPNLTTRATASNMGASDILEVFSIYAQATTASSELSRVLINFDISSISSARTATDIPGPGSVNFYLRMFNAEHPFTLPEDYKIVIAPISSPWDEGIGLDMDGYTDEDESNWTNRVSGTAWTVAGGDFLTGSGDNFFTQSISNGDEDILVDVTAQVEEWINGNTGSYGFGVFLTSSVESDTNSYYTKKFHARKSEYFLKRPVLEARWDDSLKDDSSKFFLKSNRLSTADNLQTLYFYNYINGELKNLPGDPSNVYLSVYSASGPSGNRLALPAGGGVNVAGDSEVTGSKVSTGIYSASFMFDSSSISTIYPLWHNNSSTEFYTGSAISVTTIDEGDVHKNTEYVVNITNLKPVYKNTETAYMRVYTRKKHWQPTIYTVARNAAPLDIITSVFYRITREQDQEVVVDYGTGSVKYTQLSYDASGSYFDFDMSMLEPDYSYKVNFVYEENGEYQTIKQEFKFRVEE